MSPKETSPTHAALSFQLVAALDAYGAQLEELARREGEASSWCLAKLTDGLRSVRVKCAAFPGLRAWFVELLIGHSELVFFVGPGGQSADAGCRMHRSLLIAAQRKRAENLMRHALQPLSVHHAANDPAVTLDRPVEHL